MKKKLIVIILLVIFATTAMLTSCTQNKNDKIIVAKVDGEKITKTEYLRYWDNFKANNNITQDILDNPDYAQQIEELKQQVLNSLINKKISTIELTNLGYFELSKEEHDTVKASVNSDIQNMLSLYQNEIAAELGAAPSEKDTVKVINKYTQMALEEYNLSEDFLTEAYTYNLVIEKAQLDLVDLSVSEDDILELYNEIVEYDKDYFSDLNAYEYYTTQGGYNPFYTPEGMRLIRHVLIKYDEEAINNIRTARSSGNNDEADKLKKEAMEAIQAQADDVLLQLQDGTIDFSTAIQSYNEDTGMLTNPDGYLVFEGSSNWVPEFTEGAMALEKIGDISGLIGTDYGYHILEYSSDAESGPVDLELVRNSLITELEKTKRDEGWQAKFDEWLLLHEVEYFYENLLDTEDSTPLKDEPK